MKTLSAVFALALLALCAPAATVSQRLDTLEAQMRSGTAQLATINTRLAALESAVSTAQSTAQAAQNAADGANVNALVAQARAQTAVDQIESETRMRAAVDADILLGMMEIRGEIRALSESLAALQASVEAMFRPEEPEEPQRPDWSVRRFVMHTGATPFDNDPEDLQRRWGRAVGEQWHQRWAASEPKQRIWAEEGAVLRLWRNTMVDGATTIEAMPGNGMVLHNSAGEPILIKGFESYGAVSDLTSPGVIDAKLSSFLSIVNHSSPFTCFFFDNTSVHPLSGFGVWTGVPSGITNGLWDAALGEWIDRACAALPPGSSIVGNIGHWTEDRGYAWMSTNHADLWAADWINARDPRFMPLLENYPQFTNGFNLVHVMETTEAIDRPFYINVMMSPADFTSTVATSKLNVIWALYAMLREPGSAISFEPIVSQFADRAAARDACLAYHEQIEPAWIARVEALGARTSLTFPPLGQTANRTVVAEFEHGTIRLNTRNAAALAEVTEWEVTP